MIRIFFGCILLITASCGLNKEKYHVYQNISFDEISDISHDTDLPFCIVLNDSSSFASDEYINMMKVYKIPINSAIYNFANVDLKNYKWYAKLLSPQVYPVTCVFNTSRQLIDLIPGSSKESFAYIAKAIDSKQPCNEFHYNQKYEKEKIEIIRYVNNAIALKRQVDDGQYVVDKIDSLLQIIRHPYVLFLKLQNQLQFKEATGVRTTAKELLLFDSAQYLFEYYDEFLIANQLLDSTYNHKTAPLIEIASNKIELSKCKVDHTYHLNINVANKGKNILKISDISTSCSCIKLISSKKHIINPNKSLTLKIEFTPDALGSLFREIYIASNSINTPIYIVSINATVQK